MNASIGADEAIFLIRASDGRRLARVLARPRAFSPSNARGLIGRAGLAPGSVFVVRDPLGSIHSFGMRFPFDAVFCDRSGAVLRIETAIGRWRLLRQPGARTIVELGAGEAARLEIGLGDTLRIGG
jgi:uncharacterized membrane protein (UPF0127 family)